MSSVKAINKSKEFKEKESVSSNSNIFSNQKDNCYSLFNSGSSSETYNGVSGLTIGPLSEEAYEFYMDTYNNSFALASIGEKPKNYDEWKSLFESFLPDVFNEIVPSLIAMPLNTLVAFFVVENLGWVNKTYLMVPWTLPLGLGAFLGTGFDWRAIVLALFCFLIAIVIYIPFVFIDNKILSSKLKTQGVAKTQLVKKGKTKSKKVKSSTK